MIQIFGTQFYNSNLKFNFRNEKKNLFSDPKTVSEKKGGKVLFLSFFFLSSHFLGFHVSFMFPSFSLLFSFHFSLELRGTGEQGECTNASFKCELQSNFFMRRDIYFKF